MALSRSSVNLVFALVVAALGSSAGIFVYLHLGAPDTRAQAAESGLPEKHPTADVANRIADLQQMSVRDPKIPTIPRK